MHLGEYLACATKRLIEAGVDSPRLSAEILACEVLCLHSVRSVPSSARLFCITETRRELSEDEVERLDLLLAKRAAGCPVAQIVGRKEFYGHDFLVSRHTLIPRPETELLVDIILQKLPDCLQNFADLGTGSGCIGCILAVERPSWRGLLIDSSIAALKVAQANSMRLGLEQRLTVLCGDIQRPPLLGCSLDILVSNPPYIAWSERDSVMEEVFRWEPRDALFSEENGLQHLAGCIKAAALTLRPGGWVLLEHGATQGQAVRQMLCDQGVFARSKTEHDLAGHERCTYAQKRVN